MFITASSTISYQPTFRNKGFSKTISELLINSELITPDYSPFIPAMDRRRMSTVLKMAIACSIDCLQQAGLSNPDGIIVGTSMGCCIHTKNFLDKIIDSDGGALSPTSFIVSTHNTIAGQISLLIKNHGYNITHTQGTLSFEQSLIDGMLGIGDDYNNLLIGGADEMEEEIFNYEARLNNNEIITSCGASFFVLSKEKPHGSCIQLIDVGSFSLVENIPEILGQFLVSNNVENGDIDLVLYAGNPKQITVDLESFFEKNQLFDYQKICGVYFTNSAFAMHYAIDISDHNEHPLFGKGINKILIVNNVIPENVGLILIEKMLGKNLSDNSEIIIKNSFI